MIVVKNFMATKLSYSVAKCVAISLQNRLPGENWKSHFSKILETVYNNNSYSYAKYGPVRVAELFRIRDEYVSYVLSCRK